MVHYLARIAPPVLSIALICLCLLRFAFGYSRPWLDMLLGGISVFAHMNAMGFTIRATIAMYKARGKVGKAPDSPQLPPYTPTPTPATEAYLHCIIIPMYKEHAGTIMEVLHNLGAHARAQREYDVVLAMEQAEDKRDRDHKTSIFMGAESKFRRLIVTTHPTIEGECRGKSSNVNYAARQAASKLYAAEERDKVVIHVCDADTLLLPSHFDGIVDHLGSIVNRQILFAVPIIFDRNAEETPPLVRAADALWTTAGLSGFTTSLVPPTSCYALPLSFAEQVGFWDTSADSIGEDFHMFLKCFFWTRGNLECVPIWSPASSCNVGGDNVLIARYHQALRHMWGSIDLGYALGQFFAPKEHSKRPVNLRAYLILAHRLYEAHLLPIQLAVFVVVGLFARCETGPLAPILSLTGVSRFVNILQTFLWMYLAESFYAKCVGMRLAHNPNSQVAKRSIYNLWDYLLFPVAGFVYGSVPGVHAQMMHLVTDRIDYKVSLKPQAPSQSSSSSSLVSLV
ncbi:hypothetical protein PYCC9005_005867 [Savitreella phatthalungensis]